MSLSPVLQDGGIDITHYEPVHGGDISHAYCLYGKNLKCFLKINEAKRYPGMFVNEMKGLQALSQNGNLAVPRVIKHGHMQDQQYLLLEWMEKGLPKADCWKYFGAGLAQLHLQHAATFGWVEDNYIGTLVQPNQQHPSWELFYSECRILPLVKNLFDAGFFSKQEIIATQLLCKRIDQIFPAEPPALLHGDMWRGNYMVNSTGYVCVFDPAVYYGHREMDIGMTKLFGGFDEQFYDAYNEMNALESGWQQRLPLAQLYPLLVHSVLFGGHYIATSKEIIKRFSS